MPYIEPDSSSTCYVYTRVSTKQQADDGISLENQRLRCMDYLMTRGARCKEEFSDKGVSGTNFTRRGLKMMMSKVQEGDFIIIYSLTRLGRNQIAISQMFDDMKNRGIHIISVSEKLETDTPMGKMMLAFMGAMSEFESNVTKERTRATLDNKRMTGQVLGRLAFGYEKYEFDGRIYAYPLVSEQCAITYLIKEREKGTSWKIIGDTMIERGWKPKSGTQKWGAASLLKILEREKIARERYGLSDIEGQELLLWERYKAPIMLKREQILNNLDPVTGTIDYIAIFGHCYGHTKEKIIPDDETIKKDIERGRLDNIPKLKEALIKVDKEGFIEETPKEEEKDIVIDLSSQDPTKLKNFLMLFGNITNCDELNEKAKLFF